MRFRATLPAAAVLAIGLLTMFPGIASAHEEVEVGHIEMAVGFGTEPDTYAGLPNSVQLLLAARRRACPRPRRQPEGHGAVR